MSEQRTTILDAIVAALASAAEPKSAPEVLALIKQRNLYEFKAKDPIGVLRAAVRKHVKAGGTRVQTVGGDRYVVPHRT